MDVNEHEHNWAHVKVLWFAHEHFAANKHHTHTHRNIIAREPSTNVSKLLRG